MKEALPIFLLSGLATILNVLFNPEWAFLTILAMMLSMVAVLHFAEEDSNSK